MSPPRTLHHPHSTVGVDTHGVGACTEENSIQHTRNNANIHTTNTNKQSRKRRNLHKPKSMPSISSQDNDRINSQRQRRSQLSLRAAKKKRNLSSSLRQEFLTVCGDQLFTQTNWPINNNNGIFRLMSSNIKGIPSQHNFLDWDVTLGHMQDLQVDCLSITEPNLDFQSFLVQDTFRYNTKQFDRHMHLTLTSSKQKPATKGSFFKPGGTLTAINGVWSGRVTKNSIPKQLQGDRFHRWGTTHLLGKQGIVSILTVYRVCKQTNGTGDNTVYLQQQADLEHALCRQCDPREQICIDLESFINALHEAGHRVIMSGDFNENLKLPTSRITTLLSNTNMTNAMTLRHPTVPLPTTYDQGSSCLDIIAISDTFDPTIVRKIGYLPFYSPFNSDHRAIYCDLDMHSLFGPCKPDVIRPVFRQFHTKNVRKSQKYLQIFEDKLSKSKIFQQVNELKKTIMNRNTSEPNDRFQSLIERCKVLESKTHQLMVSSNRAVGRTPYANGYWCSKEVMQAGNDRYKAKKQLRKISVGLGEEHGVTLEEAIQALQESSQRLREAQRSSREDRDEMLKQLAKKRAKEWRMQEASAIKIIANAEKAKRKFAKISRSTKSRNFGSLRRIMVPAPTNASDTYLDSDEHVNWMAVDDPDSQHAILLRQNAKHLARSNASMFAHGPVLDAVGWDAMGPEIQNLLEGAIDSELLGSNYPEYGAEAAAFIRALRYPKDKNGNMTKRKFQWKFGLTEYQKIFGKTSEATSCGPSGLHMSFWKVALERECIAELHAFFIWAAFELGFAYDRWQTSWHCMLQKKKEPYYNKLRIIQLFEGDFNAGLKYLLGRRLMHHLVRKNLITPELYGSIPGRTAQEAMALLQQIFDNHRLTRRNLLIDFNDAAGCYDRIRHNLASITVIRLGCALLLTLCHCMVQLHMRHYIRTAAGISSGYIRFDKNTPLREEFTDQTTQSTCYLGNIGGVGQGGGGSPVIWLSVSMPMIETYHDFADGSTINDPLDLLTFSIWVLSYVDDNSLLRTFPNSLPCDSLWRLASKEFSSWQKLLQITGGDLALEKCTCSVMKWRWSSTYGLPSLASSKDFPGTLTARSTLDPFSKQTQIKRLEPWEAQRQLGIRLPLTGSCSLEFQFRLQQSSSLATALKRAPLTSHEAYTHFRQYFLPSLSFPFPVTTLTTSQCHQLQKKYIFTLLPKVHINRHMPRVTVFSPTSLGGAQLLDLRVLQPVYQLTSLQQHLRRQDATGKSLCSNSHALQVMLGSSTQFLQLPYDPYSQYVDTENRWCYIWRASLEFDITIDSSFFWTPVSPLGAQDISLMDRAVNTHPFSNDSKQLHAINSCRMYLRLFFLSEMVISDDLSICSSFLDGSTVNSVPYCTFPTQPMPTKYQWSIWRQFITGQFMTAENKVHPPFDYTTSITVDIKAPNHCSIITQFNQSLHESFNHEPHAVIATLPTFFQYLLQGATFLADAGAMTTIKQALLQHTLEIATDGSLLQSQCQGSHSVVFCPQGNREEVLTVGARSPYSLSMSSLTTEHYGLLTAGVLLRIIIATMFTSAERKLLQHNSYPIYIDNAEVVKRGNKVQPVRLTLKAHSIPEFDLWELTNCILSALPFRLQCEWVKSHQDEGAPIQDLPLDAALNITADSVATQAYQSYSDPLPKPFLSTSVIGYYNEYGDEIPNLYQHIASKLHGSEMQQYLLNRFQWDDTIQQSILWDQLSQCLKSLPVPKRLKQLQFLYNWQNVGAQKLLFAQASQGTHGSLSSSQQQEHHECPMQCGAMESHGHYLLCTSAQAISVRKLSIEKFQQMLTSCNTCPGLVKWLAAGLSGDTISLSTEGEIGYFKSLGSQLLQSQGAIGWDAYRRGFLSRHWTRVQSMYVTQECGQTTFDLSAWVIRIIKFLWEHGQTMWEVRNNSIHGSNTDESRSHRLRLVRHKVRQLYHHQDRKYIPTLLQKDYFGLPVTQRCKQGLYSLVSWIKFVERRLHFHREEAMKRTIHAWLERSSQ